MDNNPHSSPTPNSPPPATSQNTPQANPPASPVPPASSKHSPPSPRQLHHQTTRLFQAGIILIVLLVTANFLILFIANTKLKQLTSTREQILITKANNVSLEETYQFLQTGQVQMEVVIDALPNEITIIDFIKTLESLADENSLVSSMEIRDLSGSTERYVPLKINLSTDLPNFNQYLTRIEKLPYLLHVNAFTANFQDGLWNISLDARVFVADPFSI